MLTKPDNDNDSAPMLDNHDDRIQCLIMLMMTMKASDDYNTSDTYDSTITAQCFV